MLLLVEDQDGTEIVPRIELSEDGALINVTFVPKKEGKVNIFAAIKGDEVWWEDEEKKRKQSQSVETEAKAEEEEEEVHEELDEEKELELRKQAKIQKHKQFMRSQTNFGVDIKPTPFVRIAEFTPAPTSVGEKVSIPVDTNLSLEDEGVFSLEVVRERRPKKEGEEEEDEEAEAGEEDEEDTFKQCEFEFKDGVLSFTPKKPVKYFVKTSLYGKPVDGMHETQTQKKSCWD